MKKGLFFVFVICLSVLAGCGNESHDSNANKDMADVAVEEDSAGENAMFGTEQNNEVSEQQDTASSEDNHTSDDKHLDKPNRKIIYTADLQIEVKSYQKTLNDIETQATRLQGYLVDSEMYEDEENDSKSGQITVRIPQEKFKEFIKLVEEGSSKVLGSSTSGQDVTEEYVDLESRVKSKRVAEKRLLSFMEEAEKTEDLLKISSDLANVQEEIEEITGRMKYLENKSDLATVTIHIQENKMKLSSTGQDDLNTWEQTKKQFMKSINFLITTFSSLFVFIIGNLPVLILLGMVALVVFLVIRKRVNKK